VQPCERTLVVMYTMRPRLSATMRWSLDSADGCLRMTATYSRSASVPDTTGRQLEPWQTVSGRRAGSSGPSADQTNSFTVEDKIVS
jgi:hypothetical protein